MWYGGAIDRHGCHYDRLVELRPNRGPTATDNRSAEEATPNPRLKAALCAAEYSMMEEPTADAVRMLSPAKVFYSIRRKRCRRCDHASSCSGRSPGWSHGPRAARQSFGERTAGAGPGSKDADVWKCVAFLHLDSKKMMEIEKEGWKRREIHDFRDYLEERLRRNRSREMIRPAKARQQFPEDAGSRRRDRDGEDGQTRLLVRAVKRIPAFFRAPCWACAQAAAPAEIFCGAGAKAGDEREEVAITRRMTPRTAASGCSPPQHPASSQRARSRAARTRVLLQKQTRMSRDAEVVEDGE